ncbi:unnamed protein product, partial [Tilletia controversa]
MSIIPTQTTSSVRIGLLHSYSQVQRDDEEQQLLDAYVKNAGESKPISTRKLTQPRLRAAALVDAEHGNSAARTARPPSLAALALDVTARNFPRLLRVAQTEDGDTGEATRSGNTAVPSPARGPASTPARGMRKSRRVAELANEGASGDGNRRAHLMSLMGPDGRPSAELSQRTHDRLRLLPAQHLASLQLLLQKYHRRTLTMLTLRRYFFPPTASRLHLSPAVPLITENPDTGPIRLVSAVTSHAQHLTHASLIALNRLDAKFFSKIMLQATRLEYLDLSACLNVNASVIQALVTGCRDEGKPSRLRYLNLDATGIGAHGLAAAISSFHSLEALKAANVQGLDDVGFYQATLNAISVEADVSEAGSGLASASRPLGCLRSLKLRRTAVGDGSLSLLLGMCDPSLLQTLDIGFTRCSLEGLLEAMQAPAQHSDPDDSEFSARVGEADAFTDRLDHPRQVSPGVGSQGGGGGMTTSLSQPATRNSDSIEPRLSQQLAQGSRPADLGPSGSQQPLPQAEYRSKFSLRKLSLSGLYLHSSRGPTENRLQPLKNLLKTQTELRSLYLQRVPHFSRECDLVQDLVGVLREGLRNMLEMRAGPDGLPDIEGADSSRTPSSVPLFKKLVLSDNPALGFRVIDGRTGRGWVFLHLLQEEEEMQAGELAKLMHSVGVFCEEIRLSNVTLLAPHLAFSPYQRILELDHTAVENFMILAALERANMYRPDVVELEPPLIAATPLETAMQIGRTRSGRAGAPATSKRTASGKGKAREVDVKEDILTFGNLRRISLTDAKVSDVSLKPLLDANPFLQEIDLTSCRSVPVVQRRNYFEHVLGEDEIGDDDEDADNTRSDTDSYEVRQRSSRLNPHRGSSDRRAAIARRQAASGTTLTRQELHDDDFIMDSDSDYDEGRPSRARRRSNPSSPRKRSGSTSPSKRSVASSSSQAAQRRNLEGAMEAVKSAKTARLAAAARLHASAHFPESSTSASSSFPRSLPSGPRPSGSPAKRRAVEPEAQDTSSEESEMTELSSDSDVGSDSDGDEEDDRPLSQRRLKRRRLNTDGSTSVAGRRRRPTRSAARNLSLVDQFPVEDNEDEDPDFSVPSSRGGGGGSRQSPNKSGRQGPIGGSARSASSSGQAIGSSSTAHGPTPFTSTSSRTVDVGGNNSNGNSSSSRRRSASPTRSPSSRVR